MSNSHDATPSDRQGVYAVNHRATMKSVRWNLTRGGADAVLSELGSDEHFVTNSPPLLGWAASPVSSEQARREGWGT